MSKVVHAVELELPNSRRCKLEYWSMEKTPSSLFRKIENTTIVSLIMTSSTEFVNFIGMNLRILSFTIFNIRMGYVLHSSWHVRCNLCICSHLMYFPGIWALVIGAWATYQTWNQIRWNLHRLRSLNAAVNVYEEQRERETARDTNHGRWIDR